MKIKNPFKLVAKKEDYREKDQRIVSRWLKELEEEGMTADECMDMCLRFVVCVTSTFYGPTTYNRKMVIKMFDERMKETFAAVSRELKKDKGFLDD